ncbi:glucose dehydrogenase [Nephila pilipes]|uniref:Glucose dehydrogenase n=1 Tax=Nephila pilipes TaxID=299642 RepID=A0A8X6PNM7_NEPPI|nr:glucose dehydrogenase [Nephila pilipes]
MLINKALAFPSGKTIGGSGVINSMLYVRGNKHNYNDWAKQGATGWSYDDVLPYFKKMEDNENFEYVKNGYHGVKGPVTVTKPRYNSPLKLAVLEAALDKGYHVGDINGPKSLGFYNFQATMRNGQRCSAAKAYLVPNDHKKNLDIVSDAFVTKIVIEDLQAKGVEFNIDGLPRFVKANKEVIMAAGTINTAQLLMLSGIGPKEELEKHRIPVKADLPVGKNLQDHATTSVNFELNDDIPTFGQKQVQRSNILEYVTSKAGPLASTQGANVLAFLKENNHTGPHCVPDLQLNFLEGSAIVPETQLNIKPEYFEAIFGPYVNKPFYWCLAQVIRPKSRGEVTLRSADPYEPPIIDPKYLSNPRDMEAIVEDLDHSMLTENNSFVFQSTSKVAMVLDFVFPPLPYNLTEEASYHPPYGPLLPLILFSMMAQKHTPVTTRFIRNSYDYVVVGGGSAGSVVAARLAEKECVSVLLLEAGKPPPKTTDIPAASRSFIMSDIDWDYYTAPQEHTGNGLINRSLAWPSGKTLGGSGVINAMLYLRGNRHDYDDWEKQGATGWSYDDVLPYFKKAEDNVNFEYVKNGYHGINGPLTVSKPRYNSPLKPAVLQAALEKGYHVGDINGPKSIGFYDLQANIRNGQRCSAAKAYLAPNDYRTNLDIVSGAFVKKIVIDDLEAKGVEFDFEGIPRFVRADKEVILSAGTTNTAQLLMLSGIGPKEELEKHNIPVKSDLPVGKNMQDHCSSMLPFELDENLETFGAKQTDKDNILQYVFSKSGPLASVLGENVLAFLKNENHTGPDDVPDVELYFLEGSTTIPEKQLNIKPEYSEAIYGPYKNKPFYFCWTQILHPKSRGEVTLRSANPYDPPVIDPKYFSEPSDLDTVVNGMKQCKEFASSEPLKKIGSKPFSTVYPGCEDVKDDDEKYFRCVAQAVVLTQSHQVGTAKMGDPNDPTTVVDPKLRVKTVSNLRIVDASIIPIIPGGNMNNPTMMVAEKASDIIKETIQCDF